MVAVWWNLLLSLIVFTPFSDAKGVTAGPIPNPHLPTENIFVANCSHCTDKDPNRGCWNKTLESYTVFLADVAARWVKIQLNAARWDKKRENRDFSLDAALNQAVGWGEAAKGEWFTQTTLNDTLRSLLRQVDVSWKSVVNATVPPRFMCPLACDYGNQMWLYLFVASVCLNLLLALTVVPFLIRTELRDRQHSPHKLGSSPR